MITIPENNGSLFILSKWSYCNSVFFHAELSFIPKAPDVHSHWIHVYIAPALITHKLNMSCHVLWLTLKWCQYENLVVSATQQYFSIFGGFDYRVLTGIVCQTVFSNGKPLLRAPNIALSKPSTGEIRHFTSQNTRDACLLLLQSVNLFVLLRDLCVLKGQFGSTEVTQ